MNPIVTILMPARNEERYIAKTLETVWAQDFPADQMEIIVVNGMSTDRTPEVVAELARDHVNLRLLRNPQRLQSFGMNLGIREAKGEYIVRMDAHTLYAPDYVRQCVELLQRGDAGEVGGVQRAVGTTYVTNAIAAAMSFPFGVGDARFRYTDKEIYSETVYLGAWKRSTILELCGYANEVNEEGDLNFRLRKAGYRILVSPRIKLQYIVRQSPLDLMRQYAWYGRARVETLVRHPDSVLFRQLLPPVLLLALAVSAVIVPFSLWLGLFVPGVYLVTSLCASAMLAWRKGIKYFPVLPIIFSIMHFSWGAGFFAGIYRFGVPKLSLRSVLRSTVALRGKSPAFVPDRPSAISLSEQLGKK
jgi:glycosyltransferase involved in cell wall biosynthesis